MKILFINFKLLGNCDPQGDLYDENDNESSDSTSSEVEASVIDTRFGMLLICIQWRVLIRQCASLIVITDNHFRTNGSSHQ